MESLDALGVTASEGEAKDLIIATILRIAGSSNHNQVLDGILARLRSGDTRTIQMFLNEHGRVDMDEVTRFAKQHQPRDAFSVEVARREILDIEL